MPNHSLRTQTITCECGYKILIMPDLKAMNLSIEKHVLWHKNKGVTEAEATKIEDSLIAQLFDKINDRKFKELKN